MGTDLIAILSYSFQIAGALILLLWSIGKCDRKIKQMCIAEHGGMLVGTFDETGTHFTLEKESLRKNAKTVYLNIAAFVDLIIGYACAIFAQPINGSPWCVLVYVGAVVVVILLLEYLLILLLANCIYHRDLEQYEDEKNDVTIPKGMTFYEIIDDKDTIPKSK